MATIRKQIIDAIEVRPMTAIELSGLLRVSQREIESHLPNIEKTARAMGRKMVFWPAECKDCDFKFTKEKFKKPSRCPKCKGEWITLPAWSLHVDPAIPGPSSEEI